tara:strand:- start:3032 stop:3895 length:864 start_codon:yes stop_codon:yes gene_type:complete
MFGPNSHLQYDIKVDYSHRDQVFCDDYKVLQHVFVDKFNLHDYDVLFIPGSGTLGVESVFWSLNKSINVIGCEGSFTKRWRRLRAQYPPNRTCGTEDLFCQLETSVSCLYEKEGCIVDAVSSFPFYDIPKDTKIFVTCSNKQIGSLIGLSIVCVKKDYWSNLRSHNEFSYLNLSRYKEYQKISQTPSTTPTYIYKHLISRLNKLDIDEFKNKVIDNSNIITEAIGEEKIIGEKVCPALTINKKHISKEIATKWQIYGLNSNSENYHIFTYSCKKEDYQRFADEYRKN